MGPVFWLQEGKYICMYRIVEQVLLYRFQITSNLSPDVNLDFLNSKGMTEAGLLALIDDHDSDIEDGLDWQTNRQKGFGLPGVATNHGRPAVAIKCVKISSIGRSWPVATTEGVLMYSLDDGFIFLNQQILTLTSPLRCVLIKVNAYIKHAFFFF